MKILFALLLCLVATNVFAQTATPIELDPEMLFLEHSGVTSSATSTGLLSMILVPLHTAIETLPAGLSVVPSKIEKTKNGLGYPVVLFIGSHKNLTAHYPEGDFVVAPQYNEITFTMAVHGPHDSGKVYGYTSKIMVDNVPAMLLGWSLGYPKVLAKFSSSKDGMLAENPLGQLMADIQTYPDSQLNMAQYKANLAQMMAQASEISATIGRRADGKFICFDFVWQFQQARFAPVNVRLQLRDAFLGAGLGGEFDSPALDKGSNGSVQFTSAWKMNGFRECE